MWFEDIKKAGADQPSHFGIAEDPSPDPDKLLSLDVVKRMHLEQLTFCEE